jgi:hypothetical protein
VLAGLVNVQDDETGLWYQVLDKGTLANNWLESSASAMFVYSIHKAARMGYVDQSYIQAAEKGFDGLIEYKINVDETGYITLRDIVQGMGIQTRYTNYMNQTRLTNSHHGLGAFLLAATELLLTGNDPSVTPVPGILPGDANIDNAITIIDALLIAQYYVELDVQIHIDTSDVDCNGTINIVDALLVARFYVGLIDSFTGC